MPNLVIPELMIVQPMASFSGYVTYLRFQSGIDKGIAAGTTFASPFSLGEMTRERMEYSSAAIAEEVEATALADSAEYTVDWQPVVGLRGVRLFDAQGAEIEREIKVVTHDGELGTDEMRLTRDGKFQIKTDLGTVKKVKILYFYDNQIVPQMGASADRRIPTLTAKMVGVNLQARARRLAVYYSQFAAFQHKNDFGEDLGSQLAQQAAAELSYEIDSEGVAMLRAGAEFDKQLAFKPYHAAGMTAISRSQYYEMFSEVIARAKAIIYQRTQKFSPTYMVVAPDVLTIMPYLKGWTAAPTTTVNGPFIAGNVDGLKVVVSPMLEKGEFFFGVNGSELNTSAAIYAPYMSIVPTQLLGFADGTMTQGFSTLYDMRLLSCYNRVDGKMVDADDGKYSYLLVAGKITEDPALVGDDALNVKIVS